MIEFGIRLRELRIENDLSQIKLSRVLLVAQRTIFAWEKNLQEPSMEMIVNIAKYFNVTADYLLGLENDDGSKIASYKNYKTIANCNITTVKNNYSNMEKTNYSNMEIKEYDQNLVKLSAHELELLKMYRTLTAQHMDRVDGYITALYETTSKNDQHM